MSDRATHSRLKEHYWQWREDPTGLRRLARMTKRSKLFSNALKLSRAAISNNLHRGHCSVCDRPTLFVVEGSWLRDQYRCYRCRSIPRFRHLVHILRQQFPDWKDLSIHESSPHGPVHEMMRRDVKSYTPSHFWPDTPSGHHRDGFRSENLEQQTFPDAVFDIVITQDVLEHVLDPGKAFSEIARTLKPGGAHIFTVPWYKHRRSFVRASPSPAGISYHAPKAFHGNPINDEGALVVTEWGFDLADFIYQNGGLYTTAFLTIDRKLGLAGEFLEVFVSRKPR